MAVTWAIRGRGVARSGPAPRTLTDMPRAGWLAILKRSVGEFKHDDITDRAAALTYCGVTSVRAVSTNLSA
jgi:hypothetical protein